MTARGNSETGITKNMDDFLDSLTHQVREEVVGNYFNQRRLIEEQINLLQEQACDVADLGKKCKHRIYRVYKLINKRECIDKFRKLFGLESPEFARDQLGFGSFHGLRFISIRALTAKGKYKKLLHTACVRLTEWLVKYSKAYEELDKECKAVNHNINSFQQNYDLLTLIRFLKSLDVHTIEKKFYLGENFNANELSSIDTALMIKSVTMDSFELMKPPKIKSLEEIKPDILKFVTDVSEKENKEMRRIIR